MNHNTEMLEPNYISGTHFLPYPYGFAAVRYLIQRVTPGKQNFLPQ